MDSQDSMLPIRPALKKLPRSSFPLYFGYTQPFFVNDAISADSLLDATLFRKEILAFTLLIALNEEARRYSNQPGLNQTSPALGEVESAIAAWERDNQDQLAEAEALGELPEMTRWIRKELLQRLDSWRARVGFLNGPDAQEWRRDLVWDFSPNQLGKSSVRVVHPRPGGPQYEIKFDLDEPIRESTLVRMHWLRRKWDWEWEQQRWNTFIDGDSIFSTEEFLNLDFINS